MRYRIIRTDVADSQIRSIILYVAEVFGNQVALEKLKELEESILALAENPYLGTRPQYPVLKRQGYKVLILKKNLVFYKVKEEQKEVIIYAVIDGRQEYLRIIQGL
ncbi:type II toxin-antitoxin system RelE/ParE family toxin [Lachnospiraceae bacterium oral taxon 500]|nr:type II toxin-antitoxin system RelE/ParE family toxin [Lachnospiraceae bacterium oral taxon 500]